MKLHYGEAEEAFRAELVAWPESSAPFMFEEDVAAAQRVRMLARQARVPILLGSDQIDWRVENHRRVPDRSYNSAFLVEADKFAWLLPFAVTLMPAGLALFYAAAAAAARAGAGQHARLVRAGCVSSPGSTMRGATPSSSRARAMLSARLVLARSP